VGGRRWTAPENGPASVIVEVSRLALPDLLVEIEAVAAVS
jgi:enamine deaminase RidA (YjgF/YER057c/UK114 family)